MVRGKRKNKTISKRGLERYLKTKVKKEELKVYSLGMWIAIIGIVAIVIYMLIMVIHLVLKTGKRFDNSSVVYRILGVISYTGLLIAMVTKII